MADIWSKRKRSEVMRRIRSQGNEATELRLIALLREHRISGWRRKQALPGKPDFVFREQRVCVFTDGCFWHGCPTCYRRPGSNREYWDEKVQRNRKRDQEVNRVLRKAGWRVLRIWEHELSKKREAGLEARIRKHLVSAVQPSPATRP